MQYLNRRNIYGVVKIYNSIFNFDRLFIEKKKKIANVDLGYNYLIYNNIYTCVNIFDFVLHINPRPLHYTLWTCEHAYIVGKN